MCTATAVDRQSTPRVLMRNLCWLVVLIVGLVGALFTLTSLSLDYNFVISEQEQAGLKSYDENGWYFGWLWIGGIACLVAALVSLIRQKYVEWFFTAVLIWFAGLYLISPWIELVE